MKKKCFEKGPIADQSSHGEYVRFGCKVSFFLEIHQVGHEPVGFQVQGTLLGFEWVCE